MQSPFGVGLIESYEVIMDNIVAIVVATIVSTFGVIVAVGWVFQLLNRKSND